jgi:molybdopterin-guanine dinucleotide biosynthesis protein A
LIEHAIHRLGPQVSNLVINANRNQDIYSQYGYPIVADENQDFAGPLAGYLVGLKACNTPYLMTAPCDSPLFPTDLVTTLAEILEKQKADIAYASSQDPLGKIWAQPVFCLMKREVRDSLEQFLAAGQRKIDRWFASQHACTAIFPNESAFANANTPEELAQLEKITP